MEMLEKNLSEQNAYEAYLLTHLGLNRDAYDKVFALKEEMENGGANSVFDKGALNETFIKKAQEMAEFSGIEISGDIVKIFALLREHKDIKATDDTKTKEALNYMKLGDQQLLAGVLFQHGESEALKKFVKAYPEIFSNSRE